MRRTYFNSRQKYFNCFAWTSERNWTEKIILQQEKEELQAVVSARKARLSGKRKVIDGDSLISTAEKLKGIREAERVTQERGVKRQKASKRRNSRARKESSDESEIELDNSNDRVIEIFESIEVKY